MSGGVAYVWDVEGDFTSKCNTGTFELEKVQSEADISELKNMIEKHEQLHRISRCQTDSG